MSIAVVRAFISLKELILKNADLGAKLEKLRSELHGRIDEHDTQLAAIYDTIENLLDDKMQKTIWEKRERVGFKR